MSGRRMHRHMEVCIRVERGKASGELFPQGSPKPGTSPAQEAPTTSHKVVLRLDGLPHVVSIWPHSLWVGLSVGSLCQEMVYLVSSHIFC